MADFFSGLAEGLRPGLDYWAKQGQKDRIAKILGNAQSMDQLNDQSMDPMAQLAAMRAAQGGQAPQAPAAPPPAAPTGGQPLPGFNARGPGNISRGLGMGGGPPIAPAPQAPMKTNLSVQPYKAPPPNVPTGEPGGASAPTGMGADITDPIKEGQSIIQNMVGQLRAANPKAPMRDIMDAVDSQLDRIKGIAPITKAVMQGQIQLVKAQGDLQFKYTKLDAENERFAAKLKELAARHAEQAEFDQAREDHMRRMDAINSARADTLARGVDVREEVGMAGVNQRERASERSSQTRLTVESMGEQFKAHQTFDRLTDSNKQKVLGEVSKRMSANPSLSQEDAFAGAIKDWKRLSGGGSPTSSPAPATNTKDGKPHKAPDGKTYIWKNNQYHVVG